MKDKEIRKELIILHGKIHALNEAVALLVALSDHNNDEMLMKKFAAVQARMADSAATYTTALLNDLEARDLTGND